MWSEELLGRKVRIGSAEGIVVAERKEFIDIAIIKSEKDTIRSGQVYPWPKIDLVWEMLEVLDVG